MEDNTLRTFRILFVNILASLRLLHKLCGLFCEISRQLSVPLQCSRIVGSTNFSASLAFALLNMNVSSFAILAAVHSRAR